MQVEECPEFKCLKSTTERVAFVHGWYAALDAESQKPTTNTGSPKLPTFEEVNEARLESTDPRQRRAIIALMFSTILLGAKGVLFTTSIRGGKRRNNGSRLPNRCVFAGAHFPPVHLVGGWAKGR